MNQEYRMCTKCILDTTEPDIRFDENGVCNHCRDYEKLAKKHVFTGEEGRLMLEAAVEKIKRDGKGKEYDCIMGLSGGVDSSYVAYLAKEFGLRPLAVHMDNCWDSELAVANIENIVKKLGIDLYTWVLDWEEFRDLQLAFFKSSVINLEVPTDHAIQAVLYKLAIEKNIKHILSGGNTVTEGIMPKAWTSNSNDLVNLLDIHKKFGTVPLKTYPTLGIPKVAYYIYVKNIKTTTMLNYIPYDREKIKQVIKKELDWRDYGPKHCESIFTRFYQAYILPRKFNVDKRKAHLSNMICSGQITREQALELMKKDPYPKEEIEKDRKFVIKKLGITEEEFERFMTLPNKKHSDYKTDETTLKILKFIKKITMVS